MLPYYFKKIYFKNNFKSNNILEFFFINFKMFKFDLILVKLIIFLNFLLSFAKCAVIIENDVSFESFSQMPENLLRLSSIGMMNILILGTILSGIGIILGLLMISNFILKLINNIFNRLFEII